MIEIALRKVDGKVTMDKDFGLQCSLLRNGEYTVTIKRKAKQRSLPQNALMWMWYACLEDATGQPKEDWHEYYKLKFNCKCILVGQTWRWIAQSTTRLDTAQMTVYLEQIQADAAVELGIRLPLPQDRGYNEFVATYSR